MPFVIQWNPVDILVVAFMQIMRIMQIRLELMTS